MAINEIQFQKGLSLAQFMKEYGTEEQCEAALVKARWHGGFKCPRCDHGTAYEFRRSGNRYWECKACRHQTSLRAGTIMEHGRLSLTTWYLAIYLMTQSKTNIAAMALMRQLGISWKAAWLLKHKLMEVMVQREACYPLEGDVRIDDAYRGGPHWRWAGTRIFEQGSVRGSGRNARRASAARKFRSSQRLFLCRADTVGRARHCAWQLRHLRWVAGIRSAEEIGLYTQDCHRAQG